MKIPLVAVNGDTWSQSLLQVTQCPALLMMTNTIYLFFA